MSLISSLRGVSRILLVAIGLIVIVVASVSVYIYTLPTEPEVVEKIRCTYAGSFDTGHADPTIYTGLGCKALHMNMYDSLMQLNPMSDTFEVVPHLAESYDVSSDGLVYTFYLHEGVKFHDGTELTAEAVQYTMDRTIRISTGYSWMWAGLVEVGDTKVKDKYTVEFHLRSTFAPFLATMPYLFIVNPAVIEDHIEKPGDYGEFGDYAVAWLNKGNDAGSGAYFLTEYELEKGWLMERFPDYWKGWDVGSRGGKFVDEVKLIITKEEATMKLLYEEGMSDINGLFRSTAFYDWARDHPSLNVNVDVVKTGLSIMCLPCQRPPTDDVHVRRALSYAYPYDTYCNEVRKGFPDEALEGPMPSFIWGFNDELTPYETDYDKAREELAKSKYTLDEINEIGVTLYSNPTSINTVDSMILFKESLKEIGIEANIESAPWLRFNELMQNAENSPIYQFTTDIKYPDPDAILFNTYHDQEIRSYVRNPAWYDNPEIDEMLEEARSSTDRDKRIELYKEVQRIVYEDAPFIYIILKGDQCAHRKNLDAGRYDSNRYILFYNWRWHE